MSIAPVRQEIVVQAAPERAFEVFATGSWWPKDHSILPKDDPREKIVMEPHAGGRWYEVSGKGTECNWGKVLAWDPPRRMLLGWQLNGDFEYDTSGMTEVEVTFAPEGQGTRVILEHRGFENYPETGQALRDAVGSDNGWSGLLASFGQALTAPAGSAARYFFCKLIVPRSTFMQDMSDAEGEALGQHIAYWTDLLEKKQCVLFGPVGDPAGVWGMGVITAADEAAARRMAEDDPAVTSGLGFRAEVYLMLRALVAK